MVLAGCFWLRKIGKRYRDVVSTLNRSGMDLISDDSESERMESKQVGLIN